MNIEFLKPRLTGARFDDGAIPLEFLKDLAVLQEMIMEVAKAEFLKEHPNRKRSPRGFWEGMELRLSAIESGSAIPVILLYILDPSNALFPSNNQACLERARDNVINAIGAAENNRPIHEYLPEKSLGYFDRIGRSLRDGEAIEFTTPVRNFPARLTKETRRTLVLASSKVTEFTEETTIHGTVPEADQDLMKFEILLCDGRKITAPLTAQHSDDILKAFNGYKAGIHVLIQGIGRFDRSSRLLSLDSIEHITILDPLDVPARLDEFRLLKDGWLDGEGTAPSLSGLDWLSQTFERNYPDDLPLPYVYPTIEGGVQAEWSLGRIEITLVFDLETHTGQWHELDTDNDTEDSRSLDLNRAQGWQWLVNRIRPIAGDAQ